MFVREDGTMLRPEWASRRFLALATASGLSVIRFHDLRHLCPPWRSRAAWRSRWSADYLGHANTAITADLYTHVLPSVARDGAERIAAAVPWRPAGDVSAA